MRIVGLTAASSVFISLLLGITPRMASNPSTVIIVSLGVAFLMTLLVMISSTRSESQKDKRKRGLEGLDMYSLIDRMVSDLDEDELAYLRRKLEEGEHNPKRELAASIDELLSQRAEDRETKRH